jgi:uncharacterized membrane protein
MMLLTENESGEYIAGNYPTNMTQGEEASLVLEIENHEGTRTNYTIVPVVQRVEARDNSSSVLEERAPDTMTVTLAENESRTVTHTYSPQLSGENVRVAYLLYRGDPPPSPSQDSAYRHVHFWTTVSGGEG